MVQYLAPAKSPWENLLQRFKNISPRMMENIAASAEMLGAAPQRSVMHQPKVPEPAFYDSARTVGRNIAGLLGISSAVPASLLQALVENPISEQLQLEADFSEGQAEIASMAATGLIPFGAGTKASKLSQLGRDKSGGGKGLWPPDVLKKAKRAPVGFEPNRRGQKYVGTPYDMRNKVDLKKARNKMLQDIQEGAEPEDAEFYFSVGEWIQDNVPDPVQREIFTRHLAYESSDNQATANAKLAVRTLQEYARAQLEGRAPRYSHPTAVGGGRFPNQLAQNLPLVDDLTQPFDTSLLGVERKVDTFKKDIEREWQPEDHPLRADPELARRSTIDRHMYQFAGWPDKTGGTQPQYDYTENQMADMANAIQAVGGDVGTTPQEMQALGWGAKLRGEGKTPGVFGATMESHMATIPYEFTPSPSSEAGAWLESQPFETRVNYTNYMANIFTDSETGENLLYKDIGIPIYRQNQGYGFYNEQLQPSLTGTVGTGETKVRGTWVQRSQNARIAALATKYVYDQAAVPMYKLVKLKKGMDVGIRVNFNVDLTENQLNIYGAKLVEALRKVGVEPGDVGFSQVSNNQLDVLNFYGVSSDDFIGALDELAKNVPEVKDQIEYGLDNRGRYYGPELSEQALENTLRRYLGPDAFKRLQDRRVQARTATAKFQQDQTLKGPLLGKQPPLRPFLR